MKKSLIIGLNFIFLFSVLSISETGGQILRDSVYVNIIKKGVDGIYNFNFAKARDASQKINSAYPGHPVVYLLNGMTTYWENFPLIPSSQAVISFENEMRRCISLCEKDHDPSFDAEYLLANLGARGMLLMYYADNNLNNEVFPLAAGTYRYLRQAFDYESTYSDFLFFTGLYNYYREAYPEAHPVYKVLAFLFPKGDKESGLKQLGEASEKSVMLKAESAFFLANIWMNFENDYQRSCASNKYLHDLYPENKQYLSLYVKNLLLLKKYDEAENLIRMNDNQSNKTYFQVQLTIFNGILQEKKYHDNARAQQYYNKGLSDIAPFGSFGNETAAYAYFGLSRISDSMGDRQNKKVYRKKALELTDYKLVSFDD